MQVLNTPFFSQGFELLHQEGQDAEELVDAENAQHLCHPVPGYVSILISVCYDELSLGLFYASRQGADGYSRSESRGHVAANGGGLGVTSAIVTEIAQSTTREDSKIPLSITFEPKLP